MKIVNRLVSSILLISLAIFLALLGLGILKSNSFLLTFPYITFTLTLILCFFVVTLLLKDIKLHIYRSLLLIILAITPVLLHSIYFFNHHFLEENSTLFLSSLCASIAVGFISNLNLFEKHRKYMLFSTLLITALIIVPVVFTLNYPSVFLILKYALVLFSVALIVYSIVSKSETQK